MSSQDLLAIDVASEVRTLAEAQLGGTWQVPAELVRFALRCGAREIAVRRRGRRFWIRWRDARIPAGVLADLAAALDARVDAVSRQRAIAALEVAGAESLLWGGALPGANLRIESGYGEITERFERRRDGRPRLLELAGQEPSPWHEVRWSCSGLEVGRAAAWLATACRFADADVSLDGARPVRGFASGMYHVRLSEPVPCRVGLTREGDYPVLWLLRDGVVSARAAMPGYPPFEAAVELGGVVPGAASSADLRRAVQPYVAELVDRAVSIMVRLHDRLETMEPAVRQRLVVLLLRAASRNLRAAEVLELPLIDTLAENTHVLSIAEIAVLGTRHGGRLFAVGPEIEPGVVLADPAATLVASTEVRKLVSELAGIALHPPPRRRTGWVRRRVEVAADQLRRWNRRVRAGRGGRPLTDRDLIESERRLLDLVRSALEPRTVALCEGGGEVRRTDTGWIIPRRHPVLADAARAMAADAGWLYPLLLALEIDDPAVLSLRERWRQVQQ